MAFNCLGRKKRRLRKFKELLNGEGTAQELRDEDIDNVFKKQIKEEESIEEEEGMNY